jgi:hypothetical protein
MSVPVLNAGFCQFGISAFTMHDQFLPPPPPAAPLKCVPGLVEGPAFMGAPPGFFLHKKAPKVLVDGNPGIQQGHDVGYLIPHFAIPMNALCGVHMLLSKHKVMLPVSSVELEGKPVGTYLVGLLLGLICANPISMPTGMLVRFKGTVVTSASWIDILRAVGYIAVDMIFDLIWNKIKGLIPKFGTDAIMDKMKSYLIDMGIEELNLVMRELAKTLIPKIFGWEVANKIIQHVLKSWILSPIVTGGVRGTPGIGRGKAGWKPFKKDWW